MKPGPKHRQASFQDARTELGYGTTQPKFHNHRSAQSTFPYIEPDDHVDDDIPLDDDELDIFVKKVNAHIVPSDPYAKKASNPFYFVGAATKLGDCFTRQLEIIKEVEVASDSMYSVPKMYKGAKVAKGAATDITITPSRRTGTKAGWSRAAPPIDDDDDEYYSINSIKDLPDDGERSLINVRLTIRDIIRDQLKGE